MEPTKHYIRTPIWGKGVIAGFFGATKKLEIRENNRVRYMGLFLFNPPPTLYPKALWLSAVQNVNLLK